MKSSTAVRFALHQLIYWAAVGVMIPVMTLVLREIGLSLVEVGFAIAAYSFATAVLEVPSGALADLWGRRRTYTLGTVCDIGAAVLLLVAPSVAVVVIASAVRGAGRAFASGSLDALAVESIRREDPSYDLEVFFSRIGMVIPAGLAATSLLGGVLPELACLPAFGALAAASPAGGFSVNLLAHILLVGIAGMLAWVLFSEDSLDTGGETSEAAVSVATTVGRIAGQIAASIASAFRTRRLALILVSSTALGLALLSVETFWQPRLNEIVTSDNVRMFGLLGAGYFALAILGAGLSPLGVRALGGNRAAGVVIYRLGSAILLAVLAAQTQTNGFTAAYFGFFFLFAAASPVESAMLNELVPDERRSTLISVNSLLMQLGGLAGALVFGFISQRQGIGLSWTVAAIVLGLSALLYVPLIRGDTRRRPPPESGDRANTADRPEN